MRKIILDLCGGTGSWSEPYKEAGYDVRVITLPEYDVRRWREYPEIVEPVMAGEVYGILAAPPCTMFSRARSSSKTRDFRGAMEVVEACLQIVWAARAANTGGKHHKGLKFWAIENPMGLLRQFLGNPGAHFRGWEFGDEHVKFTDLWGYFNMPVGRHKKARTFNMPAYASPKAPEKYKHLKLDRAGIRAITPPRFARAFFKVNQ